MQGQRRSGCGAAEYDNARTGRGYSNTCYDLKNVNGCYNNCVNSGHCCWFQTNDMSVCCPSGSRCNGYGSCSAASNGGSCSSSSSCSSGTCKGGRCCGSKGRSTGCTKCDTDGDCAECSSGYVLTSSWVCEVSYCTTINGKCTSESGCKCQNAAHTRFSHNNGACFSCGTNYCTADTGKCTSDAACSCQDSGHIKRTHTQQSGAKCYSCGTVKVALH